MIPNVRGSVADYANEKCVYAGRCLGPINRPCAVAGLNVGMYTGTTMNQYYKHVNYVVLILTTAKYLRIQ